MDAAGDQPTHDARASLDALLAADHEIPAIIHALDGGYIRPAPGGDLLRNTEVLPTGRNLHGFDPFRIPSAFAIQDGARQAERLLARHAGEDNALPETVALVLWGTDNLKTEGGPIGQALWLLGAEPRHDSYGRLAGAQLVPLDRLGRPRIDVVITLSGIFRDLLPLQTKLLAEAALLAASADEPLDQNFVRKHALAYQAAHGGELSEAALRVFGNAEGAYGSNVNHLIDNGALDRRGGTRRRLYPPQGLRLWPRWPAGAPQMRCSVMCWPVSMLAYQNLDSIELGVTTVDHYFDTLGGISRAVQRARGDAGAGLYRRPDPRRGHGAHACPSRWRWRPAPARSIRNGTRRCSTHGYEGVRQIEAHVTNTVGWSATTGQVAPWVYQQITTTLCSIRRCASGLPRSIRPHRPRSPTG